MEKVIRVEWSEKSKKHLYSIYQYHAQFSEDRALILIEMIKVKAESIVFAKQYQIEDYNPECRRMIYEDYKILFTSEICS